MTAAAHRVDVCIVGAGLVGGAQALALADAGIRCAVIDKAPAPACGQLPVDGRVSAISAASQSVLKHIGIWDAVAPHAGPIETILVTEGGRYSDVVFDCKDVDDVPFGHMIPNGNLRYETAMAMDSHDLIATYYDHQVETVAHDYGATITCKNGTKIEADLLIVADGRYSQLREHVGIHARKFAYHQHALVFAVAHTTHHRQTATEWFFPQGPLALLPMKGGHHSCIVWTEEDRLARHLATMPVEDFMEELRRKLSGMLGELTLDSERFAYPLNLFQAERYTAPSVAVIGDAAHAIHPIAGQGVNLGYRDVAALTELLSQAKTNGQHLGAASVLDEYQRWRRFDAASMIAITDGLNRLFSSNSSMLRPVRRAGMALFQRTQPVKSFFMSAAMGLEGDLPVMLKQNMG